MTNPLGYGLDGEDEGDDKNHPTNEDGSRGSNVDVDPPQAPPSHGPTLTRPSTAPPEPPPPPPPPGAGDAPSVSRETPPAPAQQHPPGWHVGPETPPPEAAPKPGPVVPTPVQIAAPGPARPPTVPFAPKPLAREKAEPPPRTADGKIHYVLCQHGTLHAVRTRTDIEFPPGIRLTEKVPMARLTPDCLVSAFIRNQITAPVSVGDHYDGDRELVVNSTFLPELGMACVPLSVRLREGVLTLRWA